MTNEPRPAAPVARGPRTSLRAALLTGVVALQLACGEAPGTADDTPGGDGAAHAASPSAAHDAGAPPVGVDDSVPARHADAPPSASSPGDAAAHTDALLALLASCGDRERRLVTEADWATARAAPGTVALRLPEPRTLETLVSGELRLDALLLVSAPDAAHPRLLARLGDTLYSAFTRPDPARYAALMATLDDADGSER